MFLDYDIVHSQKQIQIFLRFQFNTDGNTNSLIRDECFYLNQWVGCGVQRVNVRKAGDLHFHLMNRSCNNLQLHLSRGVGVKILSSLQ